jgi:hypothetical protein
MSETKLVITIEHPSQLTAELAGIAKEMEQEMQQEMGIFAGLIKMTVSIEQS